MIEALNNLLFRGGRGVDLLPDGTLYVHIALNFKVRTKDNLILLIKTLGDPSSPMSLAGAHSGGFTGHTPRRAAIPPHTVLGRCSPVSTISCHRCGRGECQFCSAHFWHEGRHGRREVGDALRQGVPGGLDLLQLVSGCCLHAK